MWARIYKQGLVSVDTPGAKTHGGRDCTTVQLVTGVDTDKVVLAVGGKVAATSVPIRSLDALAIAWLTWRKSQTHIEPLGVDGVQLDFRDCDETEKTEVLK